MTENSSQSKVTELHVQVGIEEDVGWFQVTVHHGFAVLPRSRVAFVDRQGQLVAHAPNETLVNRKAATISNP